jgi:hypothetical protein
MIIGHFALGLGSKKWARKASFGTLLAAALWLDILGALFLLLGWEHMRYQPGITRLMPYDFYDWPLSHSLVMALAWGILLGLAYLALEKDGKGAFWVAALVPAGWLLDLVSDRPDLPFWPVEPPGYPIHHFGWGLWNSPIGTFLVEGALLAAGFWLYAAATRPRDKAGTWGFCAFGAVLIAWFLLGFRIPPPVNPNLFSVLGVVLILFVSWAYWIDDHRKNA